MNTDLYMTRAGGRANDKVPTGVSGGGGGGGGGQEGDVPPPVQSTEAFEGVG